MSNLLGKPVLIEFWASWCGPRLTKMPGLIKVYDKYRGQGFEVLAISRDKDEKKWVKGIPRTNTEFIHCRDSDEKIAKLYNNFWYP